MVFRSSLPSIAFIIPDESTKHIDWKLYGRSDKLFVKRYEEETNLRCQLVIDASSSMYYPVDEKANAESQNNKINFSLKCAAALSELLFDNEMQ